MVVGWQISESLRSDLAIDALEMAVWNRNRNGLARTWRSEGSSALIGVLSICGHGAADDH